MITTPRPFLAAAVGALLCALTPSLSAVAAPDRASEPKAERGAGKTDRSEGKADRSENKTSRAPLDLVSAKLAPVDVDPAVAIQKANAWFNSAATMIGDFVQIGPDGRRSEGKIYVARPGRLRFEYAQPATMEIVADGLSVAIRDRKLSTQDNYFLSQTPLKFLLKDNIDLNKDVKVQSVTGDSATTSILVEDKATFGGTSMIKLVFDAKSFALKQWQVTDPQGYDTLVSLFNIDYAKRPDPSLFRINNERFSTPN